MKMLICCIVVALIPGALADDPPDSLVRAVRARAALRTGSLRWQLESRIAPTPDIVLFEQTLANDDVLMSESVRELRLVMGHDGTPKQARTHRGDIGLLKHDNALWWHASRTTSAYVLPTDGMTAEELLDARQIGLDGWCTSPTLFQRLLYEAAPDGDSDALARMQRVHAEAAEVSAAYAHALQHDPHSVKYREQRDGDLYVVTARCGEGELRWWLNPAEGWNPVKTEVWRGTRLLARSRVKNRLFGDTWFPDDVWYLSPAFQNGEQPFQVLHVTMAEFNRPEHPTELRPDLLGMESGMRVTVADGEGTADMVWDGRELVSPEEFDERVAAGAATYGPSLMEERTRAREGRTSQPAWTVEPDPFAREAGTGLPRRGAPARDALWEAYVRDFIAKHQLAEGPANRAWAILRSCQIAANTYLLKRRSELQRVEQELAEQWQTGDKAAIEKLRARQEKLSAPIEEIFVRQLKPRLEKLIVGRTFTPMQPAAPPSAGGSAPDK